MKKQISVLLSIILLFTAVIPVFALDYSDPSRNVPVILIGGDGEPICDADGNEVFSATELTKLFNGVEGGSIYESIANVLQPFLLEGVLFNRWDRYYENLESEIGALTEQFRLDENGNAVNGTDIARRRYDGMAKDLTVDKASGKGYYAYSDYHFWYDWRLDPMEIADRLAEYIDGVLAVTGKSKVAIISRCVGTNVAMAYVSKYGTSKIYGFGIDGTITNGGEFLSEAISGKFKLNGPALERFLTDCNLLGVFNISDFAIASVDLLVKSGALDGIRAVTRATVYDKIKEGATSAIAMGTVFTMPCYWAFVTAEDFDTAKQYVFGPVGGEKRQRYAGLIKKLDTYHNEVRLHLAAFLTAMHEQNVNISIISKYGFQMVPICESNDAISDQYASVTRSSFGATTGTVYETLSDDYIAAREAEGKANYISPDRLVDASTCLFSDYTWFTKGIRHGDWQDVENQIMYNVITADRQLTVNDLPYTQFIVFNSETEEVSPMTAENCSTEYWQADPEADSPKSVFVRLLAFLRSYNRWLRLFIDLLRAKLAK